ncbi:hypothetical protein COHA_009455 [Chlorella ohadii]|uniref:Cyanobacterial aminoacyl-tRNA synthetase CAAD domain-containing protein n=1 Tax=Chlorella ohadii TaxID=2649997 RepID=A0AAD5DI53_9CHLO|nr:hypothetical protein COHA_009455 [Chlorella ohadii]
MLATSTARLTAAPVARPAKIARRPLRTAAVNVRAVATGADKPSKDALQDVASDASAALQAKGQELLTYAQAKWEASDNKPGLVATGVVGLVGLYLVSGLVNTVDHLPLLNKLFELLGLGVSAWFAYRWFFVAGEREAITKEVSKVANKIGLDL